VAVTPNRDDEHGRLGEPGDHCDTHDHASKRYHRGDHDHLDAGVAFLTQWLRFAAAGLSSPGKGFSPG